MQLYLRHKGLLAMTTASGAVAQSRSREEHPVYEHIYPEHPVRELVYQEHPAREGGLAEHSLQPAAKEGIGTKTLRSAACRRASRVYSSKKCIAFAAFVPSTT